MNALLDQFEKQILFTGVVRINGSTRVPCASRYLIQLRMLQGEGYLPPLQRSEAEWKGRAKRGLHKRSAEAWGHALRARGAELPLAALVAAFVLAFKQIRDGVAGRNRPARGGGGGCEAAADGRRLPP